jgi:hypothetical protein
MMTAADNEPAVMETGAAAVKIPRSDEGATSPM